MKCAMLVALSALTAMAICQDVSGKPPVGTITVKEQDRDVREVLRDVFKQANKSYSVAPEVQGKVTVSLEKTTLESALPKVLDQVNATYRLDGEVYMIYPWVSVSSGPTLDGGLINGFHVSDVSPQDAFNALPRSKQIVVDPRIVGTVSVTSNGLTYRQTLDKIAQQVDAKVIDTPDAYHIVPLDSLRKPIVRLERQDADLRLLITELLRSTGVSYLISTGIAGKVTVDLKDTDVATALDILLQPIGGKITLRRGVYIVSTK